MARPDGRTDDELRPITFERDFTEMADGSCLVSFGKTRVLCTASIDDDVPRWMRNSGKGWVTAEYSMLPGASPERIDREAARGKQSGRTVEIQRLIGRSLRAACDMKALGERQVVVDCDVLQADGGTRTASICGGFVALHDALERVVQRGDLPANPLHSFCTAISVGIVGGTPVLDLPYVEDSTAEVDMNVVMLRPIAGGEAALRRGAGHRRGHGVHPRRTRCARGARRGRPRARSPTCRPSCHRHAAVGSSGSLRSPDDAARVCVGEPRQGGRDPATARRRRRPAAPARDVPDVVEDAGSLVGNARLKAVGALCGDRAAGRRRRHRARGRCARRRARRRRRALRRRGLQLRRQPHKLLAELDGRRRIGGPRSRPWRSWCGPTGRSCTSRACAPG